MKERDSGSGSVYTYGTPPEKSHVASLGQFSLTSTNVAIPTIPPQRLQGLYGNHMRHVRETMPGSGDSGTGAKPTHSHIRPYPTTNHALHTQQAPRPRPPSDLPAFAKLHATHGYATLPGPHQMPRPRIRTTHALKTQTTSPKTPQIHSISPKWSALWAHPSPTPSDLPAFAKLHATHGYATLPGPHQMPRPRIRTTHALKTQTTSPKTPQIHSISPKWSALWAHTVQLEARRRRHNGCAYDLHHCGTRTLHHRCKQR